MLFDGLLAILSEVLLFSSFVSNKNSFPKPLSPEKEQYYIDLSEKGDKEAKNVLIKHNMRLVAHVAKKYNNYPDYDELISVGSIGLIKAVNTFSKGKGTTLATYAARCIDNEILMTLRANKKYNNDVSLYDTLGTDKEGNEVSLIDMLHTDDDSIFETVEKSILTKKLLILIKESLNEREYGIICMRYGLNGCNPLTQKEVADKYQISRSYISRIEKKALSKIRERAKQCELFFD